MNIYNIETNSPEFIFRYLSWEKLISFITSQNLYLPRLDRFKDNLEGITAYQLVEILASHPLLKPDNPNLTVKQREDSYRVLLQSFNKYKLEVQQNQKTTFISCWINSNHESAGLWDNYSDDGFAIKFRRIDFEKIVTQALAETNSEDNNFIGRVRYFNFHDVFDDEAIMSKVPSFFMKHIGFKYENEYRLILVRPDQRDEQLNLKLECFNPPLFEVIASPYLTNKEFETKAIQLKEINNSIKLIESELKIWMQLRKL
ncbi:Protein of unknown function (DUF2971) [Owenweeksia hongkongensis DSM 17368]|uniref:DUF2971 domain-containing protein n=1 Tax=Owenweeksia hongkongensis (strain DSM 17368 / CIP 108786 / JCM 12287 / NRRL B-23963 / UST20020801) TaxID=926562 RepID=G8R7K4_OWEHD|nr:Protein of unknown function (DUF2971) [Owenweeksia hongkongensis DSM 17368]